MHDLQAENRHATRQHQGRIKPDDVPTIISGYEAGATMAALGRRFRVHESTICLLLQRNGVMTRGNAAAIRAHVNEAHELRDQGWTLQQIADRYRCSMTTVWRALQTGNS